MPAPWVGLEYSISQDVTEYKVSRHSSIRSERILRMALAVVGVVALPWTIYDRNYIIASLCACWILLAILRVGQMKGEVSRVEETEAICARVRLTATGLSILHEDNAGRALGDLLTHRWRELVSFKKVGEELILSFPGNMDMRLVELPLRMFPNDATRDEFLQFARGIIARQGKTPKPQYIDRTVDPLLD